MTSRSARVVSRISDQPPPPAREPLRKVKGSARAAGIGQDPGGSYPEGGGAFGEKKQKKTRRAVRTFAPAMRASSRKSPRRRSEKKNPGVGSAQGAKWPGFFRGNVMFGSLEGPRVSHCENEVSRSKESENRETAVEPPPHPVVGNRDRP